MKKIILLLVLISTSSYGQIKISESVKPITIGKVGNFAATFLYMEKTDNVYTVFYQDIKFKLVTDFKSFSFKDENNDFENLFKIIMENMENPPKDDIMLELPNDIVWLHFEKALGVSNFQFRSAVNQNANVIGISSYMTKKQVKKLFGKN
ncbi:hypothetical protein [Flavobacterium yafengii]|uniref:hypothetical protein n=1 Tax=Flavobacterium yafengii TaxID=3041253 RepID=UPI0024A90536|nr:hypothetical protein [Flavobacterium yafengii]MDI5899201.1 hypothetical protein [Flavobacterium yafengii]